MDPIDPEYRLDRPPADKPKIGDQVVVILSANLNRGQTLHQRTRQAEVTEVGRVWCVLQETGPGALIGRHWRMRLDDQTQGKKAFRQDNDRFLTAEQHAWETALNEARTYLRMQGIELQAQSRWRGREVQLAALVRAGETPPPAAEPAPADPAVVAAEDQALSRLQTAQVSPEDAAHVARAMGPTLDHLADLATGTKGSAS